MLITLVFHRVSPINSKMPFENSFTSLQKLWLGLKKEYPLLLPGRKAPLFKTSFCLTVDDSFCDFYYYVFPFLQEYQIPVVLAIAPGLIQERSSCLWEERLSIPTSSAFSLPIQEAFCSWEEIRQMVQSGLVYPASHSFSHKDLTKECDLEKEILESKKILEEKLHLPIDTFVYPFGKFNQKVKQMVKKHYFYQMRIGSCINFSWRSFSKLTYRMVWDGKKKFYLQPRHFFSWMGNVFRNR